MSNFLKATIAANRTEWQLRDVFDNRLSRAIWSWMPSGRNHSDDPNAASCPIMDTNNTMEFLVPGWEGIPTNTAVNVVNSVILLIVFYYLFIRKVYKTERLLKHEYVANERSVNWIHFIYGKRGAKELLLDQNKQTNRDDPNAYIPVILHKHRHLLEGNLESDEQEVQTKSDKPKVVDKSEWSKGSDQEKISQLRAVLFDEDSEKRRKFDEIIAEQQKMATMASMTSEASPGRKRSMTLRQWLTKYFGIKDQDIYDRRGYDAYQYLVFQRYIIYYIFCLTVICLFIILPLNLYGAKLNRIPDTYYKRTTIMNIKKDSPLIFVHALMTIGVVVLGIFLMKNFSKLIGESIKNVDKKILLIENIPELKRNPILLKEFLQKKFPTVGIKRINFLYDAKPMYGLMLNLWTAIEAKIFCRDYARQYGHRCEVRPYLVGHIIGPMGCCHCYPKVDGIQFYTNEMKELEEQIDQQLIKTTKHPERMAFVSFEDKIMANQVYNHYKRMHCKCYTISTLFKRFVGHESDEFESWQWKISYAPFPDDIDWSGILAKKWRVLIFSITMNLMILFIFIFLSTPASALNIVKYFVGTQESGEVNADVNSDPLYVMLWSYLPVLANNVLADAIPEVIARLNKNIPYRTKSDSTHSTFYKSYLYLLLVVLLLPSLQIIALSEVFVQPSKGNDTKQFEMSCLFPTENGGFFANFVITSALFGNVMDVVRIQLVLQYARYYYFYSRSPAEYLTPRHMIHFNFGFGGQYAGLLLHFTLIVTFCISNPLIAPMGLLFFVSKHLVDRYLIYHVYKPTKISQRIHSKAIVFVYISLLFLLIQIYTHLATMSYTVPSWVVGFALMAYFVFTLIEFIKDLIIFL